MKLYDFKRLIEKYSVTFCLHTSQGKFVSGKWVQDSAADKEMRGAIVPMSDHKIYQSGGTFTAEDRELYLSEPLQGILSDFTVEYKGNRYSVEQSRNFEDYADVAVYNLKRVNVNA